MAGLGNGGLAEIVMAREQHTSRNAIVTAEFPLTCGVAVTRSDARPLSLQSAANGSESRPTVRSPESILCTIGTRFPESPIPSRVLIAIGPGVPPRGQLLFFQYLTFILS